MISQAEYENFRQLFFDKVTQISNGAIITLKFVDVAYADKIDQFLGEGTRTTPDTYQFKCLYRWMKNDKQREKAGVSVETDLVVYISPLEIQNKTGSLAIPEKYMKAFQKMKVSFIGKEFEIDRVSELEPMEIQGGVMCMAYQFDLKYLVI